MSFRCDSNFLAARLFGFAVLVGALSACGSIVHTEPHVAKEARVIVSGTSSVPLTLLTSFDFTAQTNQTTGETNYVVNTSDTDTVTVPLDRTIQFNGRDRLLVLLSNPDASASPNVRLRVLIDGETLYDHTASLGASLRFAYFSL